MAFIAPFKGVSFNVDKVGSLDDVVTPPYDVINATAEDSYSQKNPYSMIRLDITKNPGGTVGDDARYQDVADLFKEWLDEGALVRDTEEALYLYTVQYKHPSGQMLIRKGLVSLVGLAEFDEGIVKPHEETFDSVIADRLRLLDTTKAQFSQIFSLYSDEENRIMNLLEEGREPDAIGSITDGDGCIHSLYRIAEPGVIKEVQEFFMERALYIADGHHRYTTALAYRKLEQERNADFSAKDPANHIMMYLCPMEDTGLSVLPTHRLLQWPGMINMEDLRLRLDPWFELEEMQEGTREVLLAEVLSRMDEEERAVDAATTFGVYHPGEDRCYLLTMKPAAKELLKEKPEELQELDVVILSDVIIEKAMELDHERCEEENLIHYYSDPDEAMDVAVKDWNNQDERTPLLFVMNPTRVKQVKQVADQKLIMPHKSTYFYPKIMTGLLFNQQVKGEDVSRLG